MSYLQSLDPFHTMNVSAAHLLWAVVLPCASPLRASCHLQPLKALSSGRTPRRSRSPTSAILKTFSLQESLSNAGFGPLTVVASLFICPPSSLCSRASEEGADSSFHTLLEQMSISSGSCSHLFLHKPSHPLFSHHFCLWQAAHNHFAKHSQKS